jgi:Fic family protein
VLHWGSSDHRVLDALFAVKKRPIPRKECGEFCIHQSPHWPKLTWDDAKLSVLLAEVRHRQGRLLGRMEGLGFRLRLEAQLSTQTADVVQSSAIEGEKLDAEEVRSSIARRLGLDYAGTAVAGREVEGMVEMMLGATF